MKIRELVIPVRPGRDMASILEVAARNELLKNAGHHAAREFFGNLEGALIGSERPTDESAVLPPVTMGSPVQNRCAPRAAAAFVGRGGASEASRGDPAAAALPSRSGRAHGAIRTRPARVRGGRSARHLWSRRRSRGAHAAWRAATFGPSSARGKGRGHA